MSEGTARKRLAQMIGELFISKANADDNIQELRTRIDQLERALADALGGLAEAADKNADRQPRGISRQNGVG